MKFNICGFNQNALIKYELDGNDVILLRTIMDMYFSFAKTLNYIVFENDKYMWLTYGYITEQVKILGSTRTIIRKIDNFIEKGILKKVVFNSRNGKSGKYMYLAPGENYIEFAPLNFSKQNENKDNQMTNIPKKATKCRNPYDKVAVEQMTDCHIKDTSINNTSIGNNSIGDYSIGNGNNVHTQKESSSVIDDIFEKYEKLHLPSYTFKPTNDVILKCINSLGIDNIFKALEIMSESDFVQSCFSVDTIFKVDNLKGALNGTFNNRKYGRNRSYDYDENYYEDANNDEIYELLGIKKGVDF
ncbi:hypothetical protein [Fusobacterium sp.]|uniref:hypothetical protein n=1 Tax=Fusobacterium sp. TaxID=68766 RepID=UPI00261DD02D|nr:hypothetical protein [Fusobacterium sp.]